MSLATPLRSAVRPRLHLSVRLGLGVAGPSQPHARSFSIWRSAKESVVEAPPTTPPPILLHPPVTSLDPTLLEPLSNMLLSLPPTAGLTYAAFIPLATIFLRTTTTLPITLWQRRRTRRLVDEVMPLVREGQRKLSLTTRDECRRQGKSFEEYQQTFKKRAKKLASSLARQHSATPLITLAVPPLVHIPIFILTSLTLRDACSRALDLVGSTLPATTSHLQHLLDLSATPLLWCDSMILPDSSMILPLCVGLAAMLNVEVSARNRRVAATGVEDPAGKVDASEGRGAGMSAADRRRIEAQRARARGASPLRVAVPRELERKQKLAGSRQLATAAAPPAPPPARAPTPADGEPPLEQDEGRTPRIVTNVLRISAVMFIPIAAMAPSAVCAYWLTSNVYTLVQNSLFAWADAKRLRMKRIQGVVDRQ